MHSKHQPKRLRYKIPICMANLSWPEQQTRQILGVRDITHPPTDNIGNQFNDLPEDNKFHARWDDPGLLQAMVRPPPRLKTSGKCREMRLIDMMCVKERLQYHFGDLCIQYGGRESTGVTWMKFYKVRLSLLTLIEVPRLISKRVTTTNPTASETLNSSFFSMSTMTWKFKAQD